MKQKNLELCHWEILLQTVSGCREDTVQPYVNFLKKTDTQTRLTWLDQTGAETAMIQIMPDTADIPSIILNRIGISSFIDWLLESYPADVVMLQIGTNDILSYYDLDNIGSRLENLANMILNDIGSDAKLYIATIPCMDAENTLYINEYYFTPESMDEIVDKYNLQIKEIVTKLKAEGKNVELADINSTLGKSDLYDGVHPNAEGYEKMGNYWYSILESYLNDTPDKDEPVPGDADSNQTVEINDLVLLGRYLTNQAEITEINYQNSDLNNDSEINIFDYILLKKILLNINND